MYNSVIVASNASFLADTLCEKLKDNDFRVYISANDSDLTAKMKSVFPRFIFLENCFHGHATDVFIQRMVKRDKNMRIVVWTACEIKSVSAARFIAAGAESFFTLRDKGGNIDSILNRIAKGQHYYPDDVKAVLDKDCAFPEIGKELTKREIEIIKLSVSGMNNQQIADKLSVSVHTIKYHKNNIYSKCGGNTPVDILRYGLIKEVIHIEDLL